VIAPDTPAEYWFGLWAQARGGPTVPQGDEEHPRKPAFSFVPHSPHGRIYGDRNGGNVYLRKQLPLDAEVILGSAGSVCSILMIDIDDLTQINKRCGTEVGDDVLQVTNMQLAENPAVWVNGRCGDDTFFAVVPNLSRDDVRLVARKTCERFRGHAWDEVEAELHVTCSIGFAHFRVDEPAEDAVARAVTGFRRAKKEGGNRALEGPRRIPPLLRDPAALRAAPIAPGAPSLRTVPPRPSAVANLISRMPGRTWNFS
jgi:diguanylate cyclase (GGDEF)-like protein